MNEQIISEVKEWYSKYLKGDFVKGVVMGGISEGYELAIQNLAVRALIRLCEDTSITPSDAVEKSITESDGFSGAQVGAAKNIVSVFWNKGILKGVESAPQDRVMEFNPHSVKDWDNYAKD